MILFRALRRMSQPLAHRLQLPDARIQFIRLGYQHLPVHLQIDQHRPHFIQRKPRSLTQGNQREPVCHVSSKLPALPLPGE